MEFSKDKNYQLPFKMETLKRFVFGNLTDKEQIRLIEETRKKDFRLNSIIDGIEYMKISKNLKSADSLSSSLAKVRNKVLLKLSNKRKD